MRLFRIILIAFVLFYSSNLTAQNVFITKTGEKYHTTNCRYLKYSKKEITLKMAKSLGYLACKVCKPTLKNSSPATKQNSSSTVVKKPQTRQPRVAAVQCSGTTKAGNRCKRRTKNATGRCYQH